MKQKILDTYFEYRAQVTDHQVAAILTLADMLVSKPSQSVQPLQSAPSPGSYTISEAAVRMCLSSSDVYDLILTGKIRANLYEGTVLISVDDIRSYEAANYN
jgi:hypothetical protein